MPPLPAPVRVRLRRTTRSLGPALTVIALVPPTARMLPPTPVQSIVSDRSIVTVPNPPESRQSISPPAAVLLSAPTKVAHGAVRLHGLASLPTPDTKVRVAWAFAGRA